jgi:KUP system potassium uptake protein
MAANDVGHISFVGQAAADDSAASPNSTVPEKHVGHEIDSVYDDEEVIATKESDFKHKQVCIFDDVGIILITTANGMRRNSRDGRSGGCPTRRLESSTVTLGRQFSYGTSNWNGAHLLIDSSTSPLYVYSSTFSSNPSHDDLLGALSLIIWSLTLIVTVKYVCIVLLADDEGEGGTFAMYNLISRYVRMSPAISILMINKFSVQYFKPRPEDQKYGQDGTIPQQRAASI